jgi:hypothetical protein
MKIVDVDHPTVTVTPVSRRLVGSQAYKLKSARPFPSHRYVSKTNVRFVVPDRVTQDRPAVLTLYYSVPRYASGPDIEEWLATAMDQLDRDYEHAALRVATEVAGESLGPFTLRLESSRVENKH